MSSILLYFLKNSQETKSLPYFLTSNWLDFLSFSLSLSTDVNTISSTFYFYLKSDRYILLSYLKLTVASAIFLFN